MTPHTEARCTGCNALYLQHVRAKLTLCCSCRKVRRAVKHRQALAREPLHERAIKSTDELEAYFANDVLQCRLCDATVAGLYKHLPMAHGVTAKHYKTIMNIPTTRGLVGRATLAKMQCSGKATTAKMAASNFANLDKARASRNNTTRTVWPSYMTTAHIRHMVDSPNHPSQTEGTEPARCHECGETNILVSRTVAISHQCRLVCDACKRNNRKAA